jgi:hypothetical protein
MAPARHRLRVLLAAVCVSCLMPAFAGIACGQQYSLSFSKNSSRMSWNHRLPSWSFSTPVRLSAPRDSTSMLRISTSASMSSTVDRRADSRNWSDNASISSSVNYPILGPRASIRVGANMSVRSATLTKQKLRNQSFNFGFQSSPLQSGRFKSLRINVTPGLITASRATRANLDSTFQEHGIQYNATLRVQPEVKVAGTRLSNSIGFSKSDNTLINNRNRSESFDSSLGYTWPGDVRTSVTMRESRSQAASPRSVYLEQDVDGSVVRDTLIKVETQETRNTSVSSSIRFKVGRFDLNSGSSYRENLRINTASNDNSPRNTYYAKDRNGKSWKVDASVSGKLLSSLVGRTSIRVDGSADRFLPVRLPDGVRYRDPSQDLKKRDLFVNGSLDWQLRRGHSLKMSTYVELKSEANAGAPEQDKDTYSSSVTTSYDGLTGGGTSISVRLASRFLHRVSLDASRSAGNSRNRDLSLSLNTRYQRLGISVSHAFSLSAKRTVYDFDREVNVSEEARKSNLRRGWSMVHTGSRQFMDSIQLNGRYSYKANDFGTLLVERGAQIVEEDSNDHTASIGFGYAPLKQLTTSVNYSYGLGRRWQYEYANYVEDRYLKSRTERENISMSADYSAKSGTQLSVRGSRSRQLSGTYDSVSITYRRPL